MLKERGRVSDDRIKTNGAKRLGDDQGRGKRGYYLANGAWTVEESATGGARVAFGPNDLCGIRT
jgi:hypothetical protein